MLDACPVIAMDGRLHLYEGHSIATVMFPVRVMIGLGIELLLVSNAAGGLRPGISAGEILLIDSHMDLMGRRGMASAPAPDGGPDGRPARRVDEAYDAELIEQGLRLARRLDCRMHRGTYAGMLGPSYETRAE
jgi:purine-nucleoside phosphorylase